MGRRQNNFRGFTLVEILIVVVILGIMATIVIPQFSNAAHEARENTLRDDLRFLRMQVGVFAAQHRDVTPGYPGGDPTASPTSGDFMNQMTLYTSEAGATNATKTSTYKFGPYLSKVPANPLNGLSTIKIVDNGAAIPAADDTTGWIYKPQTKEVIANTTGADGTGTTYTTY